MFVRPACRCVLQGMTRVAPLRMAPGSISPATALLSRFLSAEAASFLDRDVVTSRVLEVVKGYGKVDPNKVSPSAHFMNDLGLDSLDSVELVMAFEEEFALEIPDAEAEKIMTCTDAIEYVAAHPNAK
mmetsp:Transcript_18289/g.42989  ORF Transcript_18289/g.42989 Transcript_18289/m.42989 type:complete len:128 (+) Transcript_18289:44-427(+)